MGGGGGGVARKPLNMATELTRLGLVEVLGFAFAGLDSLFLHS